MSGVEAYLAPVRWLLRVLILTAVLLMPFGMAAAPAAASAHHAATMPMSHCPDGDSKQGGKTVLNECTMACSAALPAVENAPVDALLIVCTPAHPAMAQRLDDLHPDIATPPPKDS